MWAIIHPILHWLNTNICSMPTTACSCIKQHMLQHSPITPQMTTFTHGAQTAQQSPAYPAVTVSRWRISSTSPAGVDELAITAGVTARLATRSLRHSPPQQHVLQAEIRSCSYPEWLKINAFCGWALLPINEIELEADWVCLSLVSKVNTSMRRICLCATKTAL